MIYILIVTLSLLSLNHIIPIHDIDSRDMKIIKCLSIVSVILGLVNILCGFNLLKSVYSLILIYIIAYTIDHPIKYIFSNSSKENFNTESPFKRTLLSSNKNDIHQFDSLYPSSLLENLSEQYVYKNNPMSYTAPTNKMIDVPSIQNDIVDKLNKLTANIYWNTSLSNLYTNPINSRTASFAEKNPVTYTYTPEDNFLSFLNFLGNYKYPVITLIFLIILIYVYHIWKN